MNKAGKKTEGKTNTRKLMIVRLKKEYPEISKKELLAKLQEVYHIKITRQSLYRDLEWLRSHDINEITESDKKSLLEIDRMKVNSEIKYNEDLRKRAKDANNISSEVTAGKLIKDLVVDRALISKKIEEMNLNDKEAERPQYFVSIGKPRKIDMKLYRQKQKEMQKEIKGD